MVVADHEPPALGQQAAEVLLPPQHRSTESLDEQHRRLARIAEGLRAELDTTRLDQPLRSRLRHSDVLAVHLEIHSGRPSSRTRSSLDAGACASSYPIASAAETHRASSRYLPGR